MEEPGANKRAPLPPCPAPLQQVHPHPGTGQLFPLNFFATTGTCDLSWARNQGRDPSTRFPIEKLRRVWAAPGRSV